MNLQELLTQCERERDTLRAKMAVAVDALRKLDGSYLAREVLAKIGETESGPLSDVPGGGEFDDNFADCDEPGCIEPRAGGVRICERHRDENLDVPDAFDPRPAEGEGIARIVAASDKMHPHGRCTCGNEGVCRWCVWSGESSSKQQFDRAEKAEAECEQLRVKNETLTQLDRIKFRGDHGELQNALSGIHADNARLREERDAMKALVDDASKLLDEARINNAEMLEAVRVTCEERDAKAAEVERLNQKAEGLYKTMTAFDDNHVERVNGLFDELETAMGLLKECVSRFGYLTSKSKSYKTKTKEYMNRVGSFLKGGN